MGDSLHHSLVLRGMDKAVKIEKVSSSCDCLVIQSYPEEVPSGGSETIEVQLAPTKVGEFQYEVRVETSDTSDPVRVYQLNVSVVSDQLYVVTEDVKRKEGVVIVDVRSAGDFAKARVPGSLNVPAYALKTKSFLRGQDVLLIDEGFGSLSLEEACRELRHNGVRSASILWGGINAWCATSGALEGDNPDATSLSQLPAVEYVARQGEADWIVVDAKAGDVTEAINALTGMVRVVVMDADGSSYDAIRRSLGSAARVPVFYLTGGQKGYEDCVKMMTAMNRGGIGTSVPAREQKAVATRRTVAVGHKPCGSCP